MELGCFVWFEGAALSVERTEPVGAKLHSFMWNFAYEEQLNVPHSEGKEIEKKVFFAKCNAYSTLQFIMWQRI